MHISGRPPRARQKPSLRKRLSTEFYGNHPYRMGPLELVLCRVVVANPTEVVLSWNIHKLLSAFLTTYTGQETIPR